jgi:hypothetical protein
MRKYDNIKKPIRKRSAVTGQLVGVRLQVDQLKSIDTWAAKQVPPVTRPEAIRGMIDAMLRILVKDPGEEPAKEAANSKRAQELAAHAIDKMSDDLASAVDRAGRKRRLTKGPPEFREDRVDLPKAKK